MTGHHECQLFTREGDEAAESAYAYNSCTKNPEHQQFMSVNDFIDRLSCSEGGQVREWIRATADLTVKLRVGYTSQDRPDGDPLSGSRGESITRVGTGWIYRVDSEINEPCPCDNCDGQEVRKYWRFGVWTAQNVVYDTEEAKRTRVDLFYDDETSRQDGKVVSVWALRVDGWNTETDQCVMECVTHDERIGEMVESLYCRWDSLHKATRSRPICFKKSSLLDRLREAEATRSRSRPIYSKKSSLSGEGQVYTLIISHPHGQAKKITLGKLRPTVKVDNFGYGEYETATCPGSSGAPVFELYTKGDDVFLRQDGYSYYGNTHSGTQSSSVSTDQINYGHLSWFYYIDRERYGES